MMERKRENMDIDPYTEALGKLEQYFKKMQYKKQKN